LLQKRLNEAHALLETLQTNDESGEFTTSMGARYPRSHLPRFRRRLELTHVNLLLARCNRKSDMSRHPLLPEVTIALAVKLIVILAAALFVFSPKQRPRIDAASMQERLIGAPTANPQPRSILQ
jgi:hypothetical protein